MSAPHCSPPPADLPPDDVFREIFLRLPPDPSFLFSASLVCRRWRRLIRSPAFLHRFRAFHRTPPVLGFFQNLWTLPTGRRIRFVPTTGPATRISLPPGFPDWVLDCCHGRVLLYSYSDRELLVWDPMTGDKHYVGAPPDLVGEDVAAALVCAADHVDHTDCHSSPFQIIFLDCREDDQYWVCACVYSSETEVWGSCAAITIPSLVSSDSSALVGNSVYWKIIFAEEDSNHILEFELRSQRLGLIELPEGIRENYMSDIHIMPAEDGSIGFAGVSYSSIHFWSRRIDSEGVAGWALLRIIDMDKLTLSSMPAGDMFLWSSVVAFARDSDDLFLQAEGGIFMIKIRSMQLRKVREASGSAIYPYASFYTRGCDIVGIDDIDD
ncbi:F-box protein At5g03970-like [Panicum virgatum]|uniref:F-box domain-containing protein n=1 Tax=Panicum virgatum TaxID=38727 RepID=A0A8T0NKY8_PANVG|nr:F-box protein At5g03970-like [Panicum virgatum]KAG2549901.1 hypothetical protein PVAP13_9KG272500 [Panicum virgatum]KAG2549902.1 hypothetical protein PVAP13_9KG272500 [Panicum virgatum]KAG2549903.1 hypothetical protein PVAP13_9KG272500 [Panicum virgatum]